MLVRFWGVRGSLPTPISPQQIQSKIMAVVQRITADDLKSDETRARFVSNLPEWIYGTTGGNTACVELKDGDTEIILDAGSGIRALGKSKDKPKNKHYHIFFSHFHWDHIQGLPFFDDIYNPSVTIDIYSPYENARAYLEKQMTNPSLFPVGYNTFTKNITYHTLKTSDEIMIKDIKVNLCKMKHPGDSYTYSFEKNGKKVVYATDVELEPEDFTVTEDRKKVFDKADCLIIDSQYTVLDHIAKKNWGHSAFCYAVDYANFWNIRKMFIFHHEPTYSDSDLNTILNTSRQYSIQVGHPELEINLAREDAEIKL